MLIYGVLGTFGVPGLGYGVVSPTIAKWFIRRRGRATGIATAGLNVGAVAMTSLILFLISGFGWRTAWFWLGFAPWFVILPLSLLWLRRQPEDMGFLPDGASVEALQSNDQDQNPRAPETQPVEEASWTVRQAICAPSLWLLIAYEALSGMSIGALIIHRIPYMTDLGYSATQAGVSFAIYHAGAFVAKVAWGFLGDRDPVRLLAVFALVGGAVSILAGVGATNVWQLYGTFGVIYGLTGGALVVIGPLLWAGHFGRRYQGAIRGVVSPFRLVASLGGPMFAALIFDHYGSYDIAFRFCAGYLAVSAVLVWLTGRPKPPSSRVDEQ